MHSEELVKNVAVDLSRAFHLHGANSTLAKRIIYSALSTDSVESFYEDCKQYGQCDLSFITELRKKIIVSSSKDSNGSSKDKEEGERRSGGSNNNKNMSSFSLHKESLSTDSVEVEGGLHRRELPPQHKVERGRGTHAGQSLLGLDVLAKKKKEEEETGRREERRRKHYRETGRGDRKVDSGAKDRYYIGGDRYDDGRRTKAGDRDRDRERKAYRRGRGKYRERDRNRDRERNGGRARHRDWHGERDKDRDRRGRERDRHGDKKDNGDRRESFFYTAEKEFLQPRRYLSRGGRGSEKKSSTHQGRERERDSMYEDMDMDEKERKEWEEEERQLDRRWYNMEEGQAVDLSSTMLIGEREQEKEKEEEMAKKRVKRLSARQHMRNEDNIRWEENRYEHMYICIYVYVCAVYYPCGHRYEKVICL